jgi:hypothetical protein
LRPGTGLAVRARLNYPVEAPFRCTHLGVVGLLEVGAALVAEEDLGHAAKGGVQRHVGRIAAVVVQHDHVRGCKAHTSFVLDPCCRGTEHACMCGPQVCNSLGARTSDVQGVVERVKGVGLLVGRAEAVDVALEGAQVLVALDLVVACFGTGLIRIIILIRNMGSVL